MRDSRLLRNSPRVQGSCWMGNACTLEESGLLVVSTFMTASVAWPHPREHLLETSARSFSSRSRKEGYHAHRNTHVLHTHAQHMLAQEAAWWPQRSISCARLALPHMILAVCIGLKLKGMLHAARSSCLNVLEAHRAVTNAAQIAKSVGITQGAWPVPLGCC